MEIAVVVFDDPAGPDPAVAPERMLGLEVADALEQLGIALDDLGVGGRASPEDLLAFFELQGEFADEGLEPGVLAFEPALALWGAGRLERFGGVGEKLVAPLIVLRLAAHARHRGRQSAGP